MLAKQFSELEGRAVSAGEVFDKISKRLVPFEMVAKVFKDLTSEGGKFYQMQEIQAETLKGKRSNLKDAYQIMFAEIGEKMQPTMKGAVDALKDVASNYEHIGKTLIAMAKAFGVARAAAAAYQIGIGELSVKQLPIVKQLRNLAAWALKNPYVAIAAGVAVLTGAIYKLATAQSDYEKTMSIVAKTHDKYNAKMIDETSVLKFYVSQLQNATVGTKEYARAKNQLYSEYGQYLTDMQREKIEIGETIDLYDELVAKLREVYKQEYVSKGMAELSDNFRDQLDDIKKKFDEVAEGARKSGALTKGVERELWAYIRGEIDISKLSKEALDYIESINSANRATAAMPYSRGAAVKHYFTTIEQLRLAYQKLSETTREAREKMADDFELMFGPELVRESEKSLADWAEKVNATLAQFKGKEGYAGFIPALSAKDTSVLMEYVADLAKSRKEAIASMQIENGLYDEGYERSKKQVEVIDAIDKALGGVIAKYEALNDTSRTTANNDRDAVRALQDRIALLEKMKDVYNELKSYFDNDAIGKFFGANFGFVDKSLWENFDFDRQIGDAISQLESLGEAGKKAADTIKEKLAVALEKDMVDSARTAAKELEDMRQTIQKMVDDAKSVDEKIADLEAERAKLLKIATTGIEKNAINKHFDTEIDKLQESLLELNSISLNDFWAELTGGNKGGYFNLVRLEEKALKLKEAIESPSVVKNFNKSGKLVSYTLNKGDNKELFELIDEKGDKLQLTVAQVEALKKSLKEIGELKPERGGILGLIDEISKNGVKNFWKTIISDTDKGIKTLKAATTQLSKIGDVFTNIGVATQSDTMTSLGDFAKFASEMVDGIASGDYIGMLSNITSRIAQMEEKSRAIADNMAEAQRSAMSFGYTMQASRGVDSIFGMDTLRKMQNAAEIVAELQDVVNGIGDFSVAYNNTIWRFKDRTISLRDAVEELGYNFDDIESRIKGIRAVYELMSTDSAFDSNTDATKMALAKLVAQLDAYKSGLDDINESMESILGDMSASIADRIVDQWIRMGNAAADYEDILSDIKKSYAKMAIQQSVLDNVLKPITEDITEATKIGDWAKVDSLLNGAFAKIDSIAPEIAAILQKFTGLDAESSVTNLADGIKGITEDTANLLASYLNAVRADVATGNIQRSEILSVLRGITVTPNLDDYLNRIQANTYDMAQSNQRILEHLESMMTTDGGFTALRVYS